jgi:TolA-binding protein
MAVKNRSNPTGSIAAANLVSLRAKHLPWFFLFYLIQFPLLTTVGFAQSKQNTKPGNTQPLSPKNTKPAQNKLSEKEKKAEKARELYADAANAQNNGAFELAIEVWNKMLREFPEDSLASSGHHFLGICYLQLDKPDFEKAIREFKLALQDPELKQREESLVNLGWSLYQTSFDGGRDLQVARLQEASKVLAAVIDKYPDGSFVDKALFYAAEAEARSGNKERAISLYKQVAQLRKYASSSVRPDAIYGLGITFEEMKQFALAKESYDLFLSKFPSHPLVRDVRLRVAEVALQQNDAVAAVGALEPLINSKDFHNQSNSDYILYRYGFALAKAGDFNNSAKIYQELSQRYPTSQYAKNSSLAAGQTLMREKKYDDAIRAFEYLLPLKDERAAEAAHWICQIKTMQGKLNEVSEIARNALVWGGNSPSSVLLKMDLADGLSSVPATRSEARKIYEQIATENPDDPIAARATYNAAFSALQLGAIADAQRWSEAFAKRFPNDPLTSDVAYIRAESTLQLGQYESSIHAFEQLIASQPNDPLRNTWELRLTVAQFLAGHFDRSLLLADELLKRPLDENARAEVLYLRGASLLKNNNSADAIEPLNRSLEVSTNWPQADEVFLTLAEAYISSNRPEEALKTLGGLIQTLPESRLRAQAEFRRAQIAANRADFDQAMKGYDYVLKETKDKALSEFAAFGKAFVCIQQEQYAEALKLLVPLDANRQNDSFGNEVRIAKAVCQRQIGQPNQAIETLEELLNSSATPIQARKSLYELGLSYAAAKRNEDAIRTLEKYVSQIEKEPKGDDELLDRALYELAWAHKLSGDTQNATDVFQSLVNRFPDSKLAGEASFHIGQAEYESSKFDRAIKAYTVAASKSADSDLQEKSIYKLGWCFFQQDDFPSAQQQFEKQKRDFPKGELILDGQFMIAECLLKQEKYSEAFAEYSNLQNILNKKEDTSNTVSEQVRALIYLHGSQSARELKKWKESETWCTELISKFPDSSYVPIAKYEKAYALQNLKKTSEAIKLYEEVAEENRNEIGARSRFMIGEAFFADRQFAKAVAEFQKVMYGYNGTQAPASIKNWQARSAYEAGRCSEVLISDLTGDRRQKAIDFAKNFYNFVVQNHADHELAEQAAKRLEDLGKSK